MNVVLARLCVLQRDKNKALKENQGNWERHMRLSDGGKGDLQWWINNLSKQRGHIRVAPPSILLTTDSSLTGWGAVCQEPNKAETKTQGLWSDADGQHHIMILVKKKKAGNLPSELYTT